MHSEERAISLSLKLLLLLLLLLCQPRLARNLFQVRNSVRPMHLFDHTFDHDYFFELPVKGAGYPINFSVFYFTPSRYPGFPACEPNLLNCA